MKTNKLYILLLVGMTLLSCEKVMPEAGEQVRRYEGTNESLTSIICYPEESGALCVNFSDNREKVPYIQYGEYEYEGEQVSYDVEITHVPTGVHCTLLPYELTEADQDYGRPGEWRRVQISLLDEFNEEQEDKTVVISSKRHTESNVAGGKFISDLAITDEFIIKVPKITAQWSEDWVNDRDSTFFRIDGHVEEHPSPKTRYVDTYRGGRTMNITYNCRVFVEKPDWIDGFSATSTRASVRAKENTTDGFRSGYIRLKDASGKVHAEFYVSQESSNYKQEQYDILMTLYNALDGPNWRYQENWGDYEKLYSNSTVPGAYTSWSGIDIDAHGRLVGINMNYFGLKGQIPNCLSRLWCLYEINMIGNELSGPIPESIGKLGNLKQLELDSNKLTGGIPESLLGLTALHTIWLSNNSLSGNIPDWMPSGLPRAVAGWEVDYELYNNYWRNYDYSKHSCSNTDHHDYDKYGKTPDGFEYGGGVEINF